MGWGSLRFINRFAVYKKAVNCSNPCYTSITWVAIEFTPYNFIFFYYAYIVKMNLRLK